MITPIKLVVFLVAFLIAAKLKAQCDASNSPTFQVATSSVTLAVNGFCGTQMNIQNAATFPMAGGPVSFTILAPGQPGVTIPEYTASSIAYTAGVWTLQVMDNTSGCITSQTLQINSLPQPTLSLATSNTVICSGQTATITVSGASTYVWNTNATTASIAVSPGATSTYSVKGTSSGGCPNTASVALNVNPSPNLTAGADQASLCVNQAIQLTAQGANTYTWNNTNTGNNYMSPVITTTGSITYSFQIQGTGPNGCVSTKTITENVWANACENLVGLNEYNKFNRLKIFPNPVADILNIELENNISEIKIYDLTGKEVMNFKNANQLDVTALPQGFYFVKIINEVKKFLKE
ncbi:hypothetical protein CNR22_22715 [Sphingobacteriaceae bacterium]|nr:hypothetical protein CNR22_22715 [Sphingobacteriaceae bacterium]